MWVCARHNRSWGGSNCYVFSINAYGTTSQYANFQPIVNGALGVLQQTAIAGLTPGTSYVLTVSFVQTSATTTTATWKVATTGGTTVASGSFTDTTPALQNVMGSCGLFAFYPTGSANLVSSIATYTDLVPVTLGVASAAAKWSPGNWKGDAGRGGSNYRQTWNVGAWFSYTWNAGASPAATLLFNSLISGVYISYYLNGVLSDNISVAQNVPISGITPNASNTLLVYVRSTLYASYRWNNGVPGIGDNTLQVLGLQIDGNSSVGAAPAANPWMLVVGDSQTEGYAINAGSSDFLNDYAFLVSQSFNALGYDTCISACDGCGWLIAGDSPTDVPAYYSVSGSSSGRGGTYNDSASRWNKIDAGVSLLDSAGQISAYGTTGTPPAVIYIDLASNDCLFSANASDMQASVTQCLAALRTAAPSAWIFIQVPFGMYYTPSFPTGATYITALKNGVAAYQAANPSDAKVVLIDFGSALSYTLSNPPYIYTDGLHFLAAGHALIAPLVTSQITPKLLSNPDTWTYTNTTARSLLALVRTACAEMGLNQPSSLFGNPDPTVTQLLALAQREGREFSHRANDKGGWTALRNDYTFNLVPSQAIVSGTASGTTCTLATAVAHGLSVGQIVNVKGATPAAYNGTFTITGVTTLTFTYSALSAPAGPITTLPTYAVVYPVPGDYQFYLPQTMWDANFRWQTLGPLSAQEWNVLQYGISPVGPRLRFQIRNNLIYINPAPGATQTDLVGFTYISNAWCSSAGGAPQSLWAADTDTYKLDEDCFIMGLQWRFKKAKGFFYDDLLEDYEKAAAVALARDGGSRSLPLNAEAGDLSLLSSAQIPDSGYGS